MRIAGGENKMGFRIGGCPPVGILPPILDENTQYFGTFPIHGHRMEEMSIFCSFEYLDWTRQNFITKLINKAIGSNAVQCVFHSPAERALNSKFKSDLDGYAVHVENERSVPSENLTPDVSHKIGGIPFLEYDHPAARKVSEDLLNSGYFLVLTWSFPDCNDVDVKGEWPFHNYTFRLFFRILEHGYEYKALLV